jgi:hypothetical protein
LDRIKKVGSITLECKWVRILEYEKLGQTEDPEKKLDKIPEKALKGRAISTYVKLGQPQNLAKSINSVDYEYLADRTPFARFTFKYRSRSTCTIADAELSHANIRDQRISRLCS